MTTLTDTGTPVKVWSIPNFVRLWVGETASAFGIAISSVLLSLVAITSLQASAFWVGAIAASAWLPWLVIGLPAGAWVDALSPRLVLIAANSVCLVALASIPVAWWLNLLGVPQLLVVEFVVGTAGVFFRAAWVRILPMLVPRPGLPAANSAITASESLAQTTGPPLGGQLAAVIAPALGVVAQVVGYAVSVVMLWRIRLEHSPESDPSAEAESLAARIGQGLRFTFSDRLLRFFTVAGSIANFGLTGYSTLLVLFLVRQLDVGPRQLGVLMALAALGNLVGALIAPRLADRLGTARTLVLGSILVAAGCAAIPFAGPGVALIPAVVGTAITGMAVVFMNVTRQAWRQGYVPEQLMARSSTASQVINVGLIPVAALTAGALSGPLGIRPTIAVMCAIAGAANLAILASPVMGRRDLPASPQQ